MNVAPSGKCFSFSIGWDGNPNCLNDGLTDPNDCVSHSRDASTDNFDYCVLNEPLQMDRVILYARPDVRG